MLDCVCARTPNSCFLSQKFKKDLKMSVIMQDFVLGTPLVWPLSSCVWFRHIPWRRDLSFLEVVSRICSSYGAAGHLECVPLAQVEQSSPPWFYNTASSIKDKNKAGQGNDYSEGLLGSNTSCFSLHIEHLVFVTKIRGLLLTTGSELVKCWL